jgi:hypothetical protein
MKKFAVVVLLIAAACSPQTTAAPLALRTAPDPQACPGAGLPVPWRFKIDPQAEEQVVAIAQDGRRFVVWWAPGFQAGDVNDPVVRAPNGEVVARDGEVVDGPLLHGYTVCATGDALYILLV